MRSATPRAVLSSAILACLLGLGVCGEAVGQPAPPPREFRGVFVTTAYNVDWPSKPDLHWRVMEDEIRAIVQRTRELNCNVIFLQVRAFGDRIHRKTTLAKPEPWSVAMNRRNDPDTTPQPKYDPLETWIRECHANGIELHAWVNPFRVDSLVETQDPGQPQPTTLPSIPTENGQHLYLDPRSKRVQTYVRKVVRDLLECKVNSATAIDEGIDGVLFDHDLPGPDKASATQSATATAPAAPTPRIAWLLKKASGVQDPLDGTMSEFIDQVFEEVHVNHKVKFGLSPLWDDTQAQTWLADGKVNYVVPELYFRGNGTPFQIKLQAWLDKVKPQAGFTPLVVAGVYTTRVQSPDRKQNDPWPAGEVAGQITDAHATQETSLKPRAHAHYSWSALRAPAHAGPPSPNNIGELLKGNLYQKAALVPPCTAAPQPAPGKPDVTLNNGNVSWQAAGGPNQKLFVWAVWLHDNAGWGPMQVFPAAQLSIPNLPGNVDQVAVAAVDRYNQASPIAVGP